MRRKTLGEAAFDCAVRTALAIAVLIVLYPLLFVITASVSSPEAVLRGEVWLLPKGLNGSGYANLLQRSELLTGFANTVLYTAVGTAVNVVLSVAAAYPLSRKDLYGQRPLTFVMVFSLLFSGGMIPTYLLVKSLGLLGTMWALIVPEAVSVYCLLIVRTYYQSGIPQELQEAAAIDGCSNIGIFAKVVLPLSVPIIAVMVLLYGVGHWNAYYHAMIYISDRGKYPLQLVLREMLIQGHMQEMVGVAEGTHAGAVLKSESIKYAAIVAVNFPILLLYPFLHKYVVKDIMTGAVKG